MVSLLLDEHIRPVVATQALAKDAAVRIVSLQAWRGGAFLGASGEAILQAAATESLTLITYDCSTIALLLKNWSTLGQTHGGVIFVDNKTIAQNDYGGLVRAILAFWNVMAKPTSRTASSFCNPPAQPESVFEVNSRRVLTPAVPKLFGCLRFLTLTSTRVLGRPRADQG